MRDVPQVILGGVDHRGQHDLLGFGTGAGVLSHEWCVPGIEEGRAELDQHE
ncbi:hypothetical protein D3C81_2180350 [compost metagenome]